MFIEQIKHVPDVQKLNKISPSPNVQKEAFAFCIRMAAFSTLIAGAGVIANDFHDRNDLTPNVCALYVEPELRRRGIAGQLLAHICKDMAAKGIGTLYLITDHTSFYERYGWEYLCMVQGDDGEQMRMYISQHVRSSMSTDKGR